MIVGRVWLITKRYISHGWVEVPQKYRFVFEMINLVVMFASLGLNLGLALLVAQCENHILLIFCGLQVIMLIIVLFYTCAYWTVGELAVLQSIVLLWQKPNGTIIVLCPNLALELKPLKCCNKNFEGKDQSFCITIPNSLYLQKSLFQAPAAAADLNLSARSCRIPSPSLSSIKRRTAPSDTGHSSSTR